MEAAIKAGADVWQWQVKADLLTALLVAVAPGCAITGALPFTSPAVACRRFSTPSVSTSRFSMLGVGGRGRLRRVGRWWVGGWGRIDMIWRGFED